MSDDSDLETLNKRFKTYDYRVKILRVQLLSFRHNSRLRFMFNGREFLHLNNCDWSKENAKSGPDTCHCCGFIRTPDAYFEHMLENPESYPPISLFHDSKTTKSFSGNEKEFSFNTDEDLEDFYNYRVLDIQNIAKWYEFYKMIKNVLLFQIKVRELNVKKEIDAVFNKDSKEWHLTDCLRSIEWENGPDTCHCQRAFEDPWKYLQKTYGYVDLVSFLKEMQLKKTPTYFKKKSSKQASFRYALPKK